jgi:transcriptional regulator with XRE-family HTH domain
MLQGASTATGTSFADSKPACVKHKEREVLVCCHCRLVQFRTRTSLCRRCHKPLDGEVWNRTELDAGGVRSELVTNEVSDAAKSLGVRVREIRKERGLTQRVLANRMNVPRTYISKVEMGRVLPSLATLCRIAAGFEVSVAYLLCDEPERRRDDEIARILADPFLAEIAQMVDKLNAVQRALILRAVRDAADYPSEFGLIRCGSDPRSDSRGVGPRT